MKTDQNRSWQARLQQQDPTLRVHLIGIGGAGLSAIATVLSQMNVIVSGSDAHASSILDRLKGDGIRIFSQQSAANLLDLPADQRPDVVLLSSAVPANNPERLAALQLDIPLVKRSSFLCAMLTGRRVIAVAGTHGKTTTTSMIVTILRAAGLDPGYIVGAEVHGMGNAAAGSGELFVIEADEYDYMFLGLNPQVAVITNIEWDHPDCFQTPAIYQQAFADFVANVAPDGLVISCEDDLGAEQLRAQLAGQQSVHTARWITYGLQIGADILAHDLQAQPGSGYTAQLDWWNAPAGLLQLQVPGKHNIRNALAALAVACWCNVPSAQALDALLNFRGAARRFEKKGEVDGVTVLDDYAHHPTEVMAILAATRDRYPNRRIWAIFQPHTYSRTQHMLYQMGDSFQSADEVIVTDIYAARETDDGSVTAADLVAASSHPHIRYISALPNIAGYLAEHVRTSDVVITLGAGDGFRIGEILLDNLRDRIHES